MQTVKYSVAYMGQHVKVCYYKITMDMLMFGLICVLLTAMAILFSLQLQKGFKRFRIKKQYTAALEAPSVSVCIPARNETHAMTRCLENVLASDYEKLEIIVFDDESADDTSILIKSFAHAGVRFVPGTKLPEGWLGKNHALDVLAKEASGTYVIFMDVDTVIQPTTISQLVGYMMTEKMDMVSVIPRRNDTWRVSVLFGPLRYFWLLLFARKNVPAAAGALWMISRKVLLDELGGMGVFKTDVRPEMAIASRLHSSRAHTLLGSQDLGVSFEKRWSSQVETSRRLLYPVAGGDPWNGIIAFLCLLLLNIPLFSLLSTFIFGWSEIQITALWFMCIFSAIYALYAHNVWRNKWWLGGLLWSAVIFQELCLFVYSLVGYATKTITWKGRPITISSKD